MRPEYIADTMEEAITYFQHDSDVIYPVLVSETATEATLRTEGEPNQANYVSLWTDTKGRIWGEEY